MAYFLLPALLLVHADVRDCVCDLGNRGIAQTRGCSLCIEATKHPDSEHVILIRDNDPAKPNRWLAMPRAHFDGANPLSKMTATERRELWNVAIAKARELWGDSWGIAMNGDLARRQCHAHVHIGKLLEDKEPEGQENDNGYYVDGPAELPAIDNGDGLWFHPAGKRLHVHTGEQITENVLMR